MTATDRTRLAWEIVTLATLLRRRRRAVPAQVAGVNQTDDCCWRCNAFYPITAPACPKCAAINPNVDYDKALAQLFSDFGLSVPQPPEEAA